MVLGEKEDSGLVVGADWSLGWSVVCMVVEGRELWRQRMVGSGGIKLEIVVCCGFMQRSKRDWLME